MMAGRSVRDGVKELQTASPASSRHPLSWVLGVRLALEVLRAAL